MGLFSKRKRHIEVGESILGNRESYSPSQRTYYFDAPTKKQADRHGRFKKECIGYAVASIALPPLAMVMMYGYYLNFATQKNYQTSAASWIQTITDIASQEQQTLESMQAYDILDQISKTQGRSTLVVYNLRKDVATDLATQGLKVRRNRDDVKRMVASSLQHLPGTFLGQVSDSDITELQKGMVDFISTHLVDQNKHKVKTDRTSQMNLDGFVMQWFREKTSISQEQEPSYTGARKEFCRQQITRFVTGKEKVKLHNEDEKHSWRRTEEKRREKMHQQLERA